jgi:hypothetical protein
MMCELQKLKLVKDFLIFYFPRLYVVVISVIQCVDIVFHSVMVAFHCQYVLLTSSVFSPELPYVAS